MLEDDLSYVIRKALKGHAMAPADAARLSGVPENEVLALTRGTVLPDAARRLAPTLGLSPAALAHLPDYLPAPLAHPEIHRIDLPFGQDRVNSWLIWTRDAVILFDTGHQPGTCLVALDAINPPTPAAIFITHGHVDHVAGIPDFTARGIIPRGPAIPGASGFLPGDSATIGSITVRATDLSGHATPALGYLIHGMDRPILVTGDALFAGSIGGCATPHLYQHALARLRETLTPLPDHTLLLPGHGPATTLGQERNSNPFL